MKQLSSVDLTALQQHARELEAQALPERKAAVGDDLPVPAHRVPLPLPEGFLLEPIGDGPASRVDQEPPPQSEVVHDTADTSTAVSAFFDRSPAGPSPPEGHEPIDHDPDSYWDAYRQEWRPVGTSASAEGTSQQPSSAAPPPAALLGRDATSEAAVTLGVGERQQGLYVVGGTGTGKTSLLLNLLLSDIDAGLGVCVLDPHGSLIDGLLARLPSEREADVILLDPTDREWAFGLNLFECADPDDPIAVNATYDRVLHIFQKLWGPHGVNPSWGMQLEDLLDNTTSTLIYNQHCTMTEIAALLDDSSFRAQLVANVPLGHDARRFWERTYDPMRAADQQEYAGSTVRRIRTFTRNQLIRHIVGQTTTTVRLRDVLAQRKILLLKMNVLQLGDEVITLLGAMLTGEILKATGRREPADRGSLDLFHFCADEYQRFATTDFPVLLAEARKYGILTTVAHQYRGQFGDADDPNRGATAQVGNKVIFRVTPEDADYLAGFFKTDPAPNPPIAEPIYERQYRRWTEIVWEPPEAESDYQSASLALALLEEEAWILGYIGLYEALSQERELPQGKLRWDRGDSATKWIDLAIKHISAAHEECIGSLTRLGAPELYRSLDWESPFGFPLKSFFHDMVWGVKAKTANHPVFVGRRAFTLPETERVRIEDVLRHVIWHCTDVKETKSKTGVATAQAFLSEVQPLVLAAKQRPYYVEVRPHRHLASYNRRYYEAGGYLYEADWELHGAPELVPWFLQKCQSLQPRLTAAAKRKADLWACRKEVQRSEYLGYDYPVQDTSGGGTRWEPTERRTRYRWKEAPPRPHADVRNEIRSMLANQNDREARCQILRDGQVTECSLRTADLRPPAPPGVVSARVARIVAATRERGYVRKRADIEEEIRARQAEYQQRSAPDRQAGPDKPLPRARRSG